MSYDLAFWADALPGERTPRSVYERLTEGQQVVGLGDFAADATVAALGQRFPGLAVEPGSGHAVWERPDGKGVLEFAWSSQHLVATARGDVAGDEMNDVIDICVDVGGGRLYDPQTGERFDGS